MNGIDIGAIANNLITYLGGAPGGYIAGAAILTTCLLWGIRILSARHAMETIFASALAWSALYIVKNIIQWA